MTAESPEPPQDTRIHPTAVVDPTAELGPGVTVGPGALIGPRCVIGAGTWIGSRAIVAEHTVMGARNEVHSGAVVGGDPQDRKYVPSVRGRLVVGDQNIFREGCTINRSVGDEDPTRIGNRNYFMTGAHVGHNSVIGDGVTMANNSCLAGHVHLHNGVFLSACCAVHQFCTVGDLVMFQYASAVSMHVPPFVLMQNGVNTVTGLNKVGLMRSGRYTQADRDELREAYRSLYRGRADRTMTQALDEAESRRWGPAASHFLSFVRERLADQPPRRRGVCGPVPRRLRSRRPIEGGLL